MKWANHEMCHIRRIGKENCIKLAKEKMSREILKPQQKKKKKKTCGDVLSKFKLSYLIFKEDGVRVSLEVESRDWISLYFLTFCCRSKTNYRIETFR